MRVLVWVRGDVGIAMQFVCFGASSPGLAGLEETSTTEDRFPDRLTVPAGAFTVHLIRVLLIHLGGPFEAVGKPALVDLVVMIDEFSLSQLR